MDKNYPNLTDASSSSPLDSQISRKKKIIRLTFISQKRNLRKQDVLPPPATEREEGELCEEEEGEVDVVKYTPPHPTEDDELYSHAMEGLVKEQVDEIGDYFEDMFDKEQKEKLKPVIYSTPYTGTLQSTANSDTKPTASSDTKSTATLDAKTSVTDSTDKFTDVTELDTYELESLPEMLSEDDIPTKSEVSSSKPVNVAAEDKIVVMETVAMEAVAMEAVDVVAMVTDCDPGESNVVIEQDHVQEEIKKSESQDNPDVGTTPGYPVNSGAQGSERQQEHENEDIPATEDKDQTDHITTPTKCQDAKTEEAEQGESSKDSPKKKKEKLKKSRTKSRSRSSDRSQKKRLKNQIKSLEKSISEKKIKSEETRKSRDRSKSKDKSKSEERRKSRDRSKSKDKSKSEERRKSRDRSKSKERRKSREKGKSARRSRSRHRSRSKSRSRSRHRSKSRSKSRGRSRSRRPSGDRYRYRRRNWSANRIKRFNAARPRENSLFRGRSLERPTSRRGRSLERSTSIRSPSRRLSQELVPFIRPPVALTTPVPDVIDAEDFEKVQTALLNLPISQHKSLPSVKGSFIRVGRTSVGIPGSDFAEKFKNIVRDDHSVSRS